MKKIKNIFILLISLAFSFLLVLLNDDSNKYYGAKKAYRVYLDGRAVAIIDDKAKFEKYIDEEKQDLKNEYNVSKVYIPEGLEIKEELTYNKKIEDTSNVYEKIKDKEPFTIDGYIITIKGNKVSGYGEDKDGEVIEKEEETKIYVLDKNIFEEAINSTVLAFIDEEKYQAYLDENQQPIGELEEGTNILNVYIKEKVTIKKAHIPVDKKIFTDSKTLARYLLFKTTEDQSVYTVKFGDTIESIANNNRLNARELLIINKDLKNEQTLLYEGQQLTIGYINPVITVVEELYQVEYQTVKYNTITEENPSTYVGYSRVTREGVDGEKLVTQQVRIENGATTNVSEVSFVVTKEKIDRVVETGTRANIVIGSNEYWVWPTSATYISEGFGWRTWEGYGRMHEGIDIASNCGTPVYAANDGTVITAEWNNSLGYYVEVDHNNGFTTMYAHLTSYYVNVGQAVSMGELIASMGSTGYSTGCHLHYAVRYNGSFINPFNLY